jgi:predicted O-methyltransferase YrrM
MDDEIHALLSENEQLRQENSILRERIDAFERSRWWRLHPRFLVRRHAQDGEPEGPPAERAPAPPRSANDVAERFRREVVAKGSFSQDWLTYTLPSLDPVVAAFTGKRAEILEIGSFEGLSTCFFLWRLRDAHITCVDTFALSIEHAGLTNAEALESTFDRNVALVDASRVRKRVGDSRRILLDLLDESAGFDLVYVDGSHLALDVVVDGALSWRLLRTGGTLVFDDYEWTAVGADPLLRPGPAIDAVLGLVEGKFELLFKGAQLAVRKTV